MFSMDKPSQLMPDIWLLPSYFPIPGAGFLAVNAFLISSEEPVLVDTGMGMEREDFLQALESVMDLEDLKWVWLTHDDADHTGNLQTILERAPNARLVANSLAVLRMSSAWPVPMDRVHWLNSGDRIRLGSRDLAAIRPPLFDNPATIGIYDVSSQAFFAADFFGAIIPSQSKRAEDVPEEDLARGMISWASTDNPWVHMVGEGEFAGELEKIRQLSPEWILSGHLPPAQGKADRFLEVLAQVPSSPPACPPDQAALEQILAQMKGRG